MDSIKRFFENDIFARHCGIEIVDVGLGTARVQMDIGPQHMNGVNVVQGGAIFTLADLAFALAVNSHGTVAVAINVSISFVKAARSGKLYAQAQETSRNHKLATCQVEVTDEAGDLVATFQGLAYRKKDKIEPHDDQRQQ